MSRRTVYVVLGVFLATSQCSVEAQTIFNDGGVHMINGPDGPIEVLNGSTVNLDSGAMVTGGTVTSPLGWAVENYAGKASGVPFGFVSLFCLFLFVSGASRA